MAGAVPCLEKEWEERLKRGMEENRRRRCSETLSCSRWWAEPEVTGEVAKEEEWKEDEKKQEEGVKGKVEEVEVEEVVNEEEKEEVEGKVEGQEEGEEKEVEEMVKEEENEEKKEVEGKVEGEEVEGEVVEGEVKDEEKKEVKEEEKEGKGKEKAKKEEKEVEGEMEGQEKEEEVKEEEVKEEEGVEEDEEEEEQDEDDNLGEQYREEMHERRTEDEEAEQDQHDEENVSDSVESGGAVDLEGDEDEQQKDVNECFGLEEIQEEDINAAKEDPEGREQGQREQGDLRSHLVLETEDRQPWRNGNGIPGAQATHTERKGEEEEEMKEEEGELPDNELWSDRGSIPLTTHREEFQDHLEKPKEEQEEFDDEETEAEYSLEDDTESDEEDVLNVYSKDSHPTDIFHSLKEFRDSSLLTDLTLSTEDGKSFHVHAPVLAAVSSLIRERLTGSDEEQGKGGERKDDEMDVEVHKWLMCFGPEVDHVGLQAVLEFAYTGAILALNRDTVAQIKAAAQTLGVPRVIDLCAEEEEEKSLKYRKQKKEHSLSAAEQMKISLLSIRELCKENVGCNVTLKALGASLHVHRVILAASSDYFRGMFTCGMKESYQPCVNLPFLLSSELEALIGCSYSGTLPLSWACVFEITRTSLQLQYQPALSLCLDFMQQEINPHSCLDVVSFAKAYEMAQLLEVADDFVLQQFQKVALTYKFKDLPAKQLLIYLSSHSLYVPSELVVFKAVVAWIQAKPKSRLRLAKELMKTIHFPLMTFKEFKEVHQAMNVCSHHSLVELYQTVFEDFCSNDTAPRSQWRTYQPKQSLVLVGGDHISEDFQSRRISRELWFVNSLRNHMGIVRAMEWRRLGEMPEPARISHEVAVLKGQLYVIAGRRYYGVNDVLNSSYRYDPLQDSWERLADLHEKRCCFSVVVLDEMLYAIGGDSNPHYRGSVERYCHTTNSWSFTRPLEMALCGHVARVLHNQIFVSGGLNSGYHCLASMFLYHPEKGTTHLADMAKSRAHHCMEILGGHLYVAGGITTDDNMATFDLLACEVYNPVANSWTAFTSLPVPHVGAGSVIFEERFYVLGGYSQEDYSDTKMAHRYDPTTQRWDNMGRMPGPNTDIRASVLCLPPHLRL